MRIAYVVSYESVPEAVFMNRADAEEYILNESYIGALYWFHRDKKNYFAEEKYEFYKNKRLSLMLNEGEYFYLEEVDFYE
jgi:hypothetical protein